MKSLDATTRTPSFEKKVEHLKEEQFMYAHLIDGILKGKFTELSSSELDKMANDHFFSFEALTPLEAEEDRLLRETIRGRLSDALGERRLRRYCGEVFFDGRTLFFPGDKSGREVILSRPNIRKLTPRKKIEILFNLNSVMSMPTTQKGDGFTYNGTGFTEWGNRSLLYSHVKSEKEFVELLSDTRAHTGNHLLKILDLGGGLGLAASEMKKIDASLETHVVTLEQEFAMANADKFHYVAAERLPADFKGAFDLILASTTFRYYLFQHIALRNAVLALRVDGRASLGVTCDAMPRGPQYDAYFKKLVSNAERPYDAMKILLGREVETLRRAEKAGKIEFKYSPSLKGEVGQGFFDIRKLEEFDINEFARL